MPAMRAIPAGVIELRDARSDSARTVALRAFELGCTAVTRAEYDAGTVDGAATGAATDTATAAGDEALPAHPVTWFDAVRWCNRASDAAGLARAYRLSGRTALWDVASPGFRLPTEAEWEWACRAGTTTPSYGPLSEIAWSADDDLAGAQPVAGKRANGFGLFDTLGNVWEWCWDYADTARYGDYRSLRGGGWADRAWSLRASVRRGSAPDAVIDGVGFRVARGAVGDAGTAAAQGWSAASDRQRADVRGPRPVGWTPLRPSRADDTPWTNCRESTPIVNESREKDFRRRTNWTESRGFRNGRSVGHTRSRDC